MKQIVQNLSSGSTDIVTAPAPMPSSKKILVCSKATLISAGTERMLVGFGKASYVEKARQQPEKVKLVLEKIKVDGLWTTINAVKSKLDQPLPLGYCNVGIVTQVGSDVDNFKSGDRVVSNASHSDVVSIGKNLCALIPDDVDDESAVFTVLASIGLQGIRLAQPTLGEAFVVIGVGLIGLLTVQLLRAHGCRVLAIDFNEDKLKLAQEFGAEICNLANEEDPIATGMRFSRNKGVDGVIITASTQSSTPVTQAAQMCRKRGRIVLVGVVGLELNRADFYEKELSFQVSCSYGPGRYDLDYEDKGFDYPIGFVRWTEQRNFEAILDMMVNKLIDVRPLITHRYLFEDADKAYQTLIEDPGSLGILLQYSSEEKTRLDKTVELKPKAFNQIKPVLGVIGAGNYASRILLPVFKSVGAQFHTILNTGGLGSAIQGKRFGFSYASTDIDSILQSTDVNTMIIATRHESHADFVVKALLAQKHVFVEKPLVSNLEQLSAVEAAYHTAAMTGTVGHLMVGFNRRFSPHVRKMKQLLQKVDEPKTIIITVNAGAIPSTHWTQDRAVGGGRIIGEACHFIDLLRYLTDSAISSVQVQKLSNKEDAAVIVLGFEDGSFGTIHYLSNGSSRFPKERIELFTAGKVLQLNNFRNLIGFGWPNFKKMTSWRQNKGQHECCSAFLSAIEHGGDAPIPFDELIEVARITVEAAELIRNQ